MFSVLNPRVPSENRVAKSLRRIAWILTVPGGLPYVATMIVVFAVFLPVLDDLDFTGIWGRYLRSLLWAGVPILAAWLLMVVPLSKQFDAANLGPEDVPGIAFTIVATRVASVAAFLGFPVLFFLAIGGFTFLAALFGWFVASPFLFLFSRGLRA